MADGQRGRWRSLWMSLCALASPACAQDAGTPDQRGAEVSGGTPDAAAPVQRGAEVSESRASTSPPLRDIPPAKETPGRRIHPVLPIPRPKQGGSDGGSDPGDR